MLVTIAPKGEKGRSFSAEVLAYAEADPLWENGGSSDSKRPVWVVFGGTEQGMRAFMANVLLGRRAEAKDAYNRKTSDRFELLKSAGYQHHSRKVGGGVVTSVYLPDLVRLDPGMVDPAGVRFVVIPAKSWVAAQRFDLAAARARLLDLGAAAGDVERDEVLHDNLAEGALLLAYLDRRCRFPVPFDPVFGAWLAGAMARESALIRPTHHGYRQVYRITGAEKVNALDGFAVTTSHERLGSILSDEIRRWHAAGGLA